MNKQRMRIPSPSAKLEWKTIAITAEDPLVFAQELQGSLQELTDQGFIINSQMPRDEALVIVASRVSEPAPPAPDTVPAAALRRRIVDMPSARAQGSTREEVLYHYIENNKQEQRSFESLIEALRLVREHFRQHMQGLLDVVPVNITTCTMTRFEAESFPMLLKMFADDLPCPPG